MALEFELTKDQKSGLCSQYNMLSQSTKKKHPIYFVDGFISISKNLLKELFRRGYSAIRTSKLYDKQFDCYVLEIKVPFKFHVNGNDIVITELVRIDTKPLAKQLDDKVWGRGNHWPSRLESVDDVNYIQLMARIEETFGTAVIHTHPLCLSENKVVLSSGDFTSLFEELEPTLSFVCVLGIEMEKFAGLVKKLDPSDKQAFEGAAGVIMVLKSDYTKKIAKILSEKCLTTKYLNAFYERRGMPIVCARSLGGRVEIYQA